MLDKAEYLAFQSTLNSPIVSYPSPYLAPSDTVAIFWQLPLRIEPTTTTATRCVATYVECAAVADLHYRSDVDEDNAEHEKFAITLRDQLIRLMEDKVAEMSSDDMFLPKLKLQETVLQFRQMYGAHPMNLIRIIKNCLSTEMKLVQDADSVC